jgi:hypothetical protein
MKRSNIQFLRKIEKTSQPQPEPWKTTDDWSVRIDLSRAECGINLLRASFDILSLFAILLCLRQLRC